MSTAILRDLASRGQKTERCELCGASLPAMHSHLLEIDARKLVCSCEACGFLFRHGGKYKRVPHKVSLLQDFQLTDGQWESLAIPIDIAFFFESSPAGKAIALYPSPAGAVESTLPLETWTEIVAQNQALQQMEPDVEALLVNRLRGARQHFILPIDECFRLVGLIRAHWRGLSGGSEVWNQVASFFDRLKERTCPT